jgi:hypothetical protein
VITKPNQEAFQGINLFNGGIGGKHAQEAGGW